MYMYNIQYNFYNNKIYREKSIPMTALWCPAFSIMAEFIMPETQQPLGIYFR